MSKYDTENTEDSIVCPYCGHELVDELYDYYDSTEMECNNCEKNFMLDVQHSIHFTTTRTPCKKGDHEFKVIGESYFNVDSHCVNRNWTIYECTKCFKGEVVTTKVKEGQIKPVINPIPEEDR